MSKIATREEIRATLPKDCPGCGAGDFSRPTFVPYKEGGVLYFGVPATIEEEHLEWTCVHCGFVFKTPSARQFHREAVLRGEGRSLAERSGLRELAEHDDDPREP